jgi:hypothetical protein
MRTRDYKPILSLHINDLEKYPVWEFTDTEEGDGTDVRPIKRLPVATLAGRVVGTRVLLANGQYAWAIIGNLDTNNSQMNEHFVTLSIERKGRWFQLARYHDPDYERRGPTGVARFLGLPVDDIFPISYDVRKFAGGQRAALTGTVLKEPRARLTRAEIIAMAVP